MSDMTRLVITPMSTSTTMATLTSADNEIPARAALLKGAPERRGVSEFELRSVGDNLLHFTGYAAVFDQPYTVTDRYGEFTEIIQRNALSRTLSRKPDVVLNINHDGLPLARTTSGTLRIGTDAHGYHVEADLMPNDPDVERVRYKLERGDLTDMSWAFRVTVDEWSDDELTRSISEVNVDGGDVSIVTTGANPGTTANPLRSALLALANPDIDTTQVLAEMRSDGFHFDLDVIRKNLDALTERAPRKTMSIRAAMRALELD